MGKHRRNTKYIKYASIAFLVVFLISGALLFVRVWESHQSDFSEQDTDESVILYNGTEYVFRDNVETFLVLGLDKFSGDASADSYTNDRQADFLMLFVFDNDANEYTAIHINRDTMTDVNVLGVAGQRLDTELKQIALAHTYGNGKEVSCRNVADAVSALFCGTKVTHYISLTMDSVPVLNDLVGGVEVTVEDDFSGIDDTLVKGETVTLRGEQALTYVRSRKGLDDSTNSTRMNRQRQYLTSLQKKTQQCIKNDENFIVDASVKMSEYIVSDRSITQLQELGRKFSEYKFVEISSIEGESKQGERFMEFYPDEDSITQIVTKLFCRPKE